MLHKSYQGSTDALSPWSEICGALPYCHYKPKRLVQSFYTRRCLDNFGHEVHIPYNIDIDVLPPFDGPPEVPPEVGPEVEPEVDHFLSINKTRKSIVNTV